MLVAVHRVQGSGFRVQGSGKGNCELLHLLHVCVRIIGERNEKGCLIRADENKEYGAAQSIRQIGYL